MHKPTPTFVLSSDSHVHLACSNLACVLSINSDVDGPPSNWIDACLQVSWSDSELLAAGQLLLIDTSSDPLPYTDQASKCRRAVNNINNTVYALLTATLTM